MIEPTAILTLIGFWYLCKAIVVLSVAALALIALWVALKELPDAG